MNASKNPVDYTNYLRPTTMAAIIGDLDRYLTADDEVIVAIRNRLIREVGEQAAEKMIMESIHDALN